MSVARLPRFRVFVDDNFHPQDESRRYALGPYPSYAAAVVVCEQIVDRSLDSAYRLGMSATQLYERYVTEGEDPWVWPGPEESPRFSARAFARRRCAEVCPLADVVSLRSTRP